MLSQGQRTGLAARLRQGRVPGSGAPVTAAVALNSGPDDRPLLVFHALGGTVYPYGHLARELAQDVRVLGVPSPVHEPEAGISLDALLDRHLHVVREAQPSGPYRLAGWSMGGILAFEIARMLERSGDHVDVVALLDAPFWLPSHTDPGDAEFAGLFVSDAARSIGPVTARPDPGRTSAAEQLGWLAGQMDPSGRSDWLASELERRFATFKINTRLLAGYRPSGTLAGDALIIDVTESPNSSKMWCEVVCGRATIRTLSGNHYSFLQPPLVRGLGAALREAVGGRPSGGANAGDRSETGGAV